MSDFSLRTHDSKLNIHNDSSSSSPSLTISPNANENNNNDDNRRTYLISPDRLEKFEFRRLLNISCGILGCCSIGATYSVGILSNGMQRVFGLSQDNMGTILSVGFLMAYFAFPAGWIMDVRGPKAVMMIATAMSVFGWGMFSLDFWGYLGTEVGGNVALLSFLCAMFFWTPGFFDPATMLTNLFMYPLDRGTIVMIQKTFMSLASTVVSLTFNGFFKVAKVNTTTNSTSSNATADNFTSTTPGTPPPQAEGLDSEESRSMAGYCLTFVGIAFIWGATAVIGVRESPSLTLKRNARNLKKKQNQNGCCCCFPSYSSGEEVIEDAARLVEEEVDGPHAVHHEAPPAAAAPTTATSLLSPTASSSATNASKQQQQQQQGLSSFDVPKDHANDQELETGVFFCHASKISPRELKSITSSPSKKFCTEEEWNAEPRIEIALLEEFPMATTVRRTAYAVLAVNFIFLWSCTLIGIYKELEDGPRYGLAIAANILVFGFFILPFVNRYVCPPEYGARVVVGEERTEKGKVARFENDNDNENTNTPSTDEQEDHHDAEQHRPEEVVLPNPYNRRFVDHVRTFDCWLFWLALAGISSTGGTLVADAYQLFSSLAKNELDSSAPTLNIGLIGIGGALGRIVIGWFEQFFLTPRRYSSTVILPLPSLTALVGLILMPLVPPQGLWFPFFLVAGGYGMSWALLLLNARQMFSVDVAQNYLFIFSAGLPTVLLQRAILGPWYDRETEIQHAAPGKCLGIDCVSLPIAVMAGMCFVGSILAWWVHVRWMRRNGFQGAFEKVPKQ